MVNKGLGEILEDILDAFGEKIEAQNECDHCFDSEECNDCDDEEEVKKTITEDQFLDIIGYVGELNDKIRSLEEGISGINSSFTVLDFGDSLKLLKILGYNDIAEWIEYWLYECDEEMEVTIEDIIIPIKNDSLDGIIRALRLDGLLVD